MINYVLQDKKDGKFGFMKVCFSQMCLKSFIEINIILYEFDLYIGWI
jgi:hypothetical protein